MGKALPDKQSEILYLSTIAFIDEESNTTNDYYLLEFCKMVIYENGYLGLTSSEMSERIKEKLLLDYTDEEIENTIDNHADSGILYENGLYCISSDLQREISRRNKNFALRRYIDLYCDTKLKSDEKIDRNAMCNIMTRFIFEKFQQSIEQIYNIIDGSGKNIKIEFSDLFTEDEKLFINDFLNWDNEEKNQMIYKLIVKSYDFCTVNCTGSTSFDFSNHHFFLDANIIMRLLGINNTYRQKAVRHFVEKCRNEHINIHISSFTKEEIKKSIDRQLTAITKEIASTGFAPNPDAIKFAKPEGFTVEFYGKYYEYCKKNKSWSPEEFKRYILGQLENCLCGYIYDDVDSFELIDEKAFEGYVNALRKIKDEAVIKTDVNNVMLVQNIRKQYQDTYMISADGRLINWCKEMFVGKTSLIEFPSIWLSIIMKYTGRASGEDYAAFCRFIKLPFHTIDKDIKKKIEIKSRIVTLDVSSQIKERMLEDLEINYSSYPVMDSAKDIVQQAYEKAMQVHDDAIRKEESEKSEIDKQNIQQYYEQKTSGMAKKLRDKSSELTYLETQTVEYKIQQEVTKKTEAKLKRGKWLARMYNRIQAMLIVVIVLIAVIGYLLLRGNDLIKDGTLGTILAIGDIVLNVLLSCWMKALKESWNDEAGIKEKFDKKIRKKYKALL